jgi:hypothetical protein
LDADEVVTPELAKEIREVIEMPDEEIDKRSIPELFRRHQAIIEKRDGKFGNGKIVAFFIPRRNMFLGKPLVHAGVYPDAVIRLIKKGKAYLPAKSVHEQMVLDGRVAWLVNDILHYDSPTLRRYFNRLNRYTDLQAQEIEDQKTPKGILYFAIYTMYKPLYTFLNLYFRHKGFMDGMRGFLWSTLSASHFPIAYFKYLTK